MEISISKVTYEKINLPDEQVEEIVVSYLKKQLFPAEWIDSQNNLKGDDPNWRHGSSSDIDYGPANAIQMAAWDLLKRIREKQQQERKLKEVREACIQKDR